MSKILYIADPEILAIPIAECGEPMIDLKKQREIAYGPIPETKKSLPYYTLMRATVYQKLCAVQQALLSGWYLRLYEGFRSLDVQEWLFTKQYDQIQQQHSNADHSEIFHETTRLVSPIRNLDGSVNIPPHNTGAAVDVEVINEEGELIDMGMAVADTWKVDPLLCQTDNHLLSDTARNNRQILLQAMQSQGFVNYPTEWWHFSYGDRYWAYHQGQSHAIYGPADDYVTTN